MTIPIGTLQATSTKPGYLVELGFSPVRRWSTRGLQDWANNVWVSGAWNYARGQLTLPGGDPELTRLILSQGTVGRTAKIWLFYGDVATDTNTELLFDGYCDGASQLIDSITLPLYDTSDTKLYAPRKRLRADTGFSVLPQVGFKLKWNGVTFVLKEDR